MKRKIKQLIGNKKVIRVIRTLTLVLIICVNSIIVLSKDNTGKTVNAAEFQIKEEQAINAADFQFKDEQLINAAEFNLNGGR